MKPVFGYEKAEKNSEVVWLDAAVVTTSIDDVWGSALTTVTACLIPQGLRWEIGPKKLMCLFSMFQLWQLQGQWPTSGFPPWKLVFLVDFWVLDKQMACFLSHLSSCPVQHKAGWGYSPFLLCWNLEAAPPLPPPSTHSDSELLEVLLSDFLPPIWQQAVGVVYAQGCVSFFPPPSPPLPCNNVVTWWSESAMPFYFPKYSHSVWGKVRLKMRVWVPPVDQLGSV